jgi:glyoxylase-like metal-dependent hydrolase (beta-lactamase superfamily II)
MVRLASEPAIIATAGASGDIGALGSPVVPCRGRLRRYFLGAKTRSTEGEVPMQSGGSRFAGLVLALGAAIALAAGSAQAQDQEAKRSIEPVTGDVYRFQNNFHNAMFVVTEDGIVVTDPINAEAVAWLKDELAARFDKPVTHMILSHSHGDHASGGQGWGDIEVIAHENAKKHVEAGDVDTAMPTETFADSHALSTGGKDFELTYLGEGHGDDLIAVVVRPENVAFVVDAVSPGRLPYRDFPGADIDGYIDQIKAVEALDFEVMLPGHSRNGTKQDATDTRIYVEKLRDGVTAALAQGKTEEEIIASELMSEYADWLAYDQFRDLNIQGMVRWLKETGRAG